MATSGYGQYGEIAILNGMFGNLAGQINATIAAGTASVTSLTARGSAGSGNWDTTPATSSIIITGTPGSGGTVNTFTNGHLFVNSGGAPTGTTFPIASQTMGPGGVTVGDSIWVGGAAAATGTTTAVPCWQLTDIYIGLSTNAPSTSSAANIATMLLAEPSGTGSYARINVLNNRANFPLAVYSTSSSVLTCGGPFSFPASTGSGWSTGSTPLVTMFLADASTNGGGNVLAYGPLGTAQAVNASGITLSFASAAITIGLT